MKPYNDRYVRTLSAKLLFDEAAIRGVKVEPVLFIHKQENTMWHRLTYKNHEEALLFELTNATGSVADRICNNKMATKAFLMDKNHVVAPGKSFHVKDAKDIPAYAKKIGFPVVIKPVDGTHGDNVFVNIQDAKTLKRHIDTLTRGRGKLRQLILEKHFPNADDFRVFATQRKFVGATRRIPANVEGDGKSTIKELISAKNKDPMRQGGLSPLKKIRVDAVVREYLTKHGQTLSSVPKKGEQVFLRGNANLSTGGDSIDVTNDLHPEYKKKAVEVIRAIPGLAYGGIDLMTFDMTKKPNVKNHIWVEINARPMLSMHHFPAVGKPRDAAKAVIDQLFPETVKKTRRKR